jgi:hypothetical protein
VTGVANATNLVDIYGWHESTDRTNQHAESRARFLVLCGSFRVSPKNSRTIPNMGFRFRRSIKILPGIRLNLGKRGISASIGVRGAHVTYGPTGTRTTVGLPGSGLSYTHLEKPHRGVPITAAAESPTEPGARQGYAWRGFLWIGVIAVAIVVAIGKLTGSAPPVQLPTPPRTVAETTAQAAAQAADDEKLAEAKRAALGATQIRHVVANSNSLRLSRVTVIPNGAICYRFHLQNSRGVTYVRTAVMDGAVLKTYGSDGFTATWNRLCAHQSGAWDITSEVENPMNLSAK